MKVNDNMNDTPLSAITHTTGDLCDYVTGEFLREATISEVIESIEAGEIDSGVGAFSVDGRTCYVDDIYGPMDLILVRSEAGNGGWSLHDPRATAEDIRGGNEPLLSGHGELLSDEWSEPTREQRVAGLRNFYIAAR